ncbi:MAG TPA: hypothetical protein DCQ06_11145 [Myxococcales bacterium]|nr:hypothetical protein [Myxococcales bacterium]HAN32144.1 hypothetical protein [Myxococcales bacterium]
MKVGAAGKLMVAGEYAVALLGTPALAVATGEIVTVTQVPSNASPPTEATITLDAFGQSWSWPMDDIPDEGLAAFIRAALYFVWQDNPPALTKNLQVRVRADRAGQKLGLGSSAATTVATLRAALALRGERRDALEIGRWADEIHRSVQGGQGSGYDVYTIAMGGCCKYEPKQRHATHLDWPKGLHAVALYSGQPASTTKALKQGISGADPRVAQIAASATVLLENWSTASPQRLLELLNECEKHFEALATSHRWLLPSAIEAIKNDIEACGAIARVSGAGGGDCVWAWSDDPARLKALITRRKSSLVATFPADLAIPGAL